MKKVQVLIMTVLFVTVCAGVAWKITREQSQYSLLKRSLSDQALNYFDDDRVQLKVLVFI
jgi:hypothetical protein